MEDLKLFFVSQNFFLMQATGEMYEFYTEIFEKVYNNLTHTTTKLIITSFFFITLNKKSCFWKTTNGIFLLFVSPSYFIGKVVLIGSSAYCSQFWFDWLYISNHTMYHFIWLIYRQSMVDIGETCLTWTSFCKMLSRPITRNWWEGNCVKNL